jgi:PAT family beta-lactamase induction signal transducer AmpG
MINPFLVETGFDALQISTVGKFLGILTAIIGGMIAGFVMKKIKIIDAVLYFGIIHALSHLFFIMQNNLGNNIYSLFIVIGVESITGGMVMASYIAFITSLCSGKYLATQYAFLSSMMGISRSIFPSISGVIVTMLGWNNFFFLITIITIPSILILIKLRKMLGR